MILGIIIGILIWNVVCCIITFTAIEDDNVIATIGRGIVGLFLLLISFIFHSIKKAIKHKRFCSVLIDPEGKPCYCKPLNSDNQSAMFEKGYHWNENIANKYKPSDGWDSFICLDKDTVNLRYTPIKIAKAESLYKIKNKELKKLTNHNNYDIIIIENKGKE